MLLAVICGKLWVAFWNNFYRRYCSCSHGNLRLRYSHVYVFWVVAYRGRVEDRCDTFKPIVL